MATLRNLGDIQGPVLVFGGPYSNLPATTAVREEALRRRISSRNVICTGDIVAYGAEPFETTDLMMKWGCVRVMGNCEESFGRGAPDCGCGFDEGSACDVLSRQWYAYANNALNVRQRDWMLESPSRVDFTMQGRRFAVIHGSADSISEFVFERTDDAVKQASLEALGVDAVIGGHSGVPFAQVLGDKLWLNAGVVGMPANDGTPNVWYAVLTPGDAGITVEILPLAYDHAAAAAAMRRQGLPEGYAACLETGLWPNMDVMPAAEREKAGVALEPVRLTWPGAEAAAAE